MFSFFYLDWNLFMSNGSFFPLGVPVSAKSQITDTEYLFELAKVFQGVDLPEYVDHATRITKIRHHLEQLERFSVHAHGARLPRPFTSR